MDTDGQKVAQALKNIRNGFMKARGNKMRDVKRIDILLELLNEYWKQNQDLRLGQMLSNISYRTRKTEDVFSMEDDVIIKWLENELKINKKND